MSEVGAFEAKTHLPKLLERVRQGERFVITKHGPPVAELIPLSRFFDCRARDADPDFVRLPKKRLRVHAP